MSDNNYYELVLEIRQMMVVGELTEGECHHLSELIDLVHDSQEKTRKNRRENNE